MAQTARWQGIDRRGSGSSDNAEPEPRVEKSLAGQKGWQRNKRLKEEKYPSGGIWQEKKSEPPFKPGKIMAFTG